jgi:putative ABC transport system permease protein
VIGRSLRRSLGDLPVAWLQLKRQPIRYLVAVTGIGFAALLMFMQLGFQSGLLTSATTFYQALITDLVVISPGTRDSGAFQQFPQSQLYQSLGVPGVADVIPVYVANVNAQQMGGIKPTSLRLIGFDPDQQILDLAPVREQIDRIRTPGYVLFDAAGNSNTGPVAAAVKAQGSQTMILSDFSKTFRVVGLFRLGSTFAADSNLISSDTTALQLAYKQINEGEISMGLIRVSDPAAIAPVQRHLRALYGSQLQVFTKPELIANEQNYWNTSSSFGIIFGFGTIMGLLVGGVIVYQVLYTDVSDHLHEYATLKALGFRNRFLLILVLQEASILAISSFVPALVASAALYAFLTAVSGIQIVMTTGKTVLVFSLTIGVCAVAAAIALNKLRDADPASVF